MKKPAVPDHTESLAEFLAAGVVPEDLPSLHPLLSARPLLAAFIALFHGGTEGVMVRLLVLREIGARAEAPHWSPRELETHFAYLDAAKLRTVLGRLRDHELLVWDGERQNYQLSSVGRMALTALDQLFKFANDNDAELGFITAQIAAGAAVGRVSSEVLRHLLARLTELETEFSTAVKTGSEFRLKRAQERLQSVWHWMEKGTEVMQQLSAEGLDDASWRIAKEIGSRQSRIMRMTGVFQRELSAIARQRVHLSQGGLTSSELAGWLRGLSVPQLAAYAAGTCRIAPETCFILADVMLDVAEFELTERERGERTNASLPPPALAEETRDYVPEPPPELPQLLALLLSLDEPTALADVVVGGSFRAAAYRFSLLPLIGEQTGDPDLVAFGAMKLRLEWPAREALQVIDRDEVAAIDAATLLDHG